MTRLVLALAILLAEYGFIAVRFDGGDLARRDGFISKLSSAGEIFTVVIVVSAAALLLRAARLRAALARATAELNAPSLLWLGAHVVAFGACIGSAGALFAREAPDAASAALAVLAALSGVASLGALARGLFGRAALELAKVVGRATLAGAALGLVAWQAGVQSRPLWSELAGTTLAAASFVLEQLGGADVHADAAAKTLGLAGFQVKIAPGCSGIEGMALSAIFVGVYLLRFRRELRLARALWLVPLAVGLAWLMNALRIAALVAIGAHWSPDVAFGGFHSKAGWLLFCAVSLGMVWLLNRSAWFLRDAPAVSAEREVIDNPTAAYCMPFLLVLGVGMLSGALAHDGEPLYWLRLPVGVAALYWARRSLRRELAGRVSWLAPAWGVAVFAAWVWLTPTDASAADTLQSALERSSPWARGAWLVTRVLGTACLAPVVEELAFRGFLLRRLDASDFESLAYARVSALGVLVSALAFGALHSSWLLGAGAGVAYALACRGRGRLADAAAAHGITNLLLAIWALAFGRLDLFA